MSSHSDLQDTYDRVADEYVRRIFHELDDKPFDREILIRFAERVRGRGPVYDLGCGPGHVARFLHEHGVAVTGVDLSSGMVRRARELNPGIEFRQGDMCALDAESGSLAGIVAFYSIVHLTPESLAAAFGELRRILAPGAPLLLAFHIGNESVHLGEWWGHEVAVDFVFFDPEVIKIRLQEAGFRIAEALEREPYPEVEHQSQRAYLLAEADPREVVLDAATPADAELLSNLLELYIHDLSEAFPGVELGPDGRFGYKKLPLYWSEPERRFAFLIRSGARIVGFAFATRGSPASDDPSAFDVAEFFVLRRHRRSDVGRRAAVLLWNRFPGKWTVRVSEGNAGALPFWARIIADFTGGAATEFMRPGDPYAWRVFAFESAPPRNPV